MQPESSYPPALPPSTPANWRLYLELASLAGLVIPLVGHIVGPLILWLIRKDSDPLADVEGRKVINFNLSWGIWMIVSCGVGYFVWLVIAIIAVVKAANNEPFRHPWTIAFLK